MQFLSPALSEWGEDKDETIYFTKKIKNMVKGRALIFCQTPEPSLRVGFARTSLKKLNFLFTMPV